MTSREEIERLLNMTGRTLEGLPKAYPEDKCRAVGRMRGITPSMAGNSILHQSDVIEILIAALKDALETPAQKPTQKPLTLKEANSYQGRVWIEFREFKADGWRDDLCDAIYWAGRVYEDFPRSPELMVHYRLWRCEPTEEERSAAAWEI